MKANTFEYPKSSFLGLSKDTALLMDKILSNQNVLKLMYYNVPDVLLNPNVPYVGSEEIKEMLIGGQISNVPRIKFDNEKKNYLILTFDSFTPNATNSFYKDHVVEIKILCNFDNWSLTDYEIRPYRIAGELDAMLNGQKLTGIGVLNFMYAEENLYDNVLGGITLKYLAVRGHEDEVDTVQGM